MVQRRERQLGEADGRTGRHRAAEASDVARRADDGDRGTTRPIQAVDALGQVEERHGVALRQEGEEEEMASPTTAALTVLLLVTHGDKQLLSVEWI
jgi:hypothetical protein